MEIMELKTNTYLKHMYKENGKNLPSFYKKLAGESFPKIKKSSNTFFFQCLGQHICVSKHFQEWNASRAKKGALKTIIFITYWGPLLQNLNLTSRKTNLSFTLILPYSNYVFLETKHSSNLLPLPYGTKKTMQRQSRRKQKLRAANEVNGG